MKLERWLWTASCWRANLEAALLAVVLIGSIVAMEPYLQVFPLFQGMVLIGALIPSLIGLRRRPLARGWAVTVLFELSQSGAITLSLLMIEMAWLALLTPGLTTLQSGQISEILVFTVSAGVYLFWRVFQPIWVRWTAMRRTRFAWALTHTFLVLVSGLALVAVMLLMLLVRFNTTEVIKAGAPPLVMILAGLTQFIYYVLLASPFAIAPTLIVVLPPVAAVSYWVSRRLARRLERLEAAAARLSQGDWSARVAPEGQDEIGRLQASFNHMAAELEKANHDLVAQRDRVAGLLRVQRELTASVSHELRTPVATALAYLENDLDRLEALPAETLRQDLEIARHEITRLQTLIDDLFTLSKAEVNQLSLELTAVDLLSLIAQSVTATAGLAWQSRRVQVRADLPPQLPFVQADASRVEQVLRNLLTNGIRHTPPGGFVIVSAEALPAGVRVTVTDSGEGISADDLPHIWERFYRGPGQPGDGRSGLGLAIVKELVDSMGGSVGVETGAEGSVFQVELPI